MSHKNHHPIHIYPEWQDAWQAKLDGHHQDLPGTPVGFMANIRHDNLITGFKSLAIAWESLKLMVVEL